MSNLPPLNSPVNQLDDSADTTFKYRRLVVLVLLVSVALAMFSFVPADVDFYADGVNGPTFPHNLMGAVGVAFSWSAYMFLGLGSVVLLAVGFICSLRRLVWRNGLRRSSWEYLLAIFLCGIGSSLLLGTFPGCFSGITTALNIQNLPGGVFGQFFCAPGVGLIHVLLNTTGSVLLSLVILVISLGVIWHYDWREYTQRLLNSLYQRWLNSQAESQVAATEAPAPAANLNSQIPAEGVHQPDSEVGYRTRRGEQSIAAARAAQEAFNGPSPAARQQFTPQAPKAPPQQLPLPIDNNIAAAAAAATPQPAPQPQPAPVTLPSPSDDYALPSTGIFTPSSNNQLESANEIEKNKKIIQDTLDQFKIDAEVVNAIPGPQVTLFEIELGQGVLVKRVGSIQSNLAMNLKAVRAVRLLLPIPGKDRAGIEVPNLSRSIVTAHELFTDPNWINSKQGMPLMLGKNINGEAIMIDLQKAPHLLVAGSTGTGKSVCMNLMIQSLLLRFSPEELKLIMFDPKFVEFQPYSTLPHLITPIISDPQKVGLVLRWACAEMDHRYKQLVAAGVRNLSEFNSRKLPAEQVYDEDGDPLPNKLPYVVIIIDELADIMAQAQKEVGTYLQRLSAKSRASGIHMIVATQRPDSTVITGVIKMNFPWRIALQVTDLTNSRVILDTRGAETLLGKGDMLFKGDGDQERIQGGWVTNEEIASVVRHCSSQGRQVFDESIQNALEAMENENDGSSGGYSGGGASGGGGDMGDYSSDPKEQLVMKAVGVLRTTRRPTISVLQRMLGIGYNRAATLMDELEDRGYVGPAPSSGMRDIYWDNLPGCGSDALADNRKDNDDDDDEPPFDTDSNGDDVA